MTETARLAPYALFAGVLASAGLPIYIHAPSFYVDAYGVGLAGLGFVLGGLRLLDFVQDPALGWLSRRLGAKRGTAVAVATGVMSAAMLGLFAVTPPVAPLIWFALTLTLLFSSFSFLTISFYARGVQKSVSLGQNGHVRLAGWRETGALAGVCLASVLPVALTSVTSHPFAAFAAIFAVAAFAGMMAMRQEWPPADAPSPSAFGPILKDQVTRRLLVVALFNAMPVAVTSTLFIFFVEHRLQARGWEGPLLLAFFLAAALSAPLWTRAALAYGPKQVLLCGMVLAIVTFAGAALLDAGDLIPFVLICIASGAALGADMTLLPALFASAAADVVPDAAEGFGLWSFASKFSLALAAITFLPLLASAGFNPGRGDVSDAARSTLSLFYAVVPLGLKAVALLLLWATPIETTRGDNQLRGAHT